MNNVKEKADLCSIYRVLKYQNQKSLQRVTIIVIMDAGIREEMLIRGYRDKSRSRSGTRLQGYADCGLEY